MSLAFSHFSCSDKVEETYVVNTPVYLSYTDLRTSFSVKSAEVIKQPGKIYFKDDFIFINEYQKGIHVINNSDPSNPQFISQFRHATACDPVVVEGDYAYVTLRSGNLCGAIESQLNVIDISVIEAPELLESYPMTEPYGLGIDDEVLFVCDGKDGLKIFNTSDPFGIDKNMIAHYKGIDAFDVIPLGNVLLLIGEDGLYQYDYSSLDDIKQLSYIPVYSN